MFIEVKEFGAKVGISSGKLVVTKEGAELGRFPLGLVEAAAVHTSVQISSQAVASLSKQGVRIMWVNMSEEIICCTSADSPRFSARRKGLYRMSESPSVCIDISGRIIRAKINSQTDTLLSMGICSSDDTAHLRALSDKAIICGNKLDLLGIEGEAAKEYYNILSRAFPENMKFEGRRKHPPKDEINAVLSYSYTLLYNRVVLELVGAGLDPYCGFLHENGYSRYTLACDLMEPLRAPVSDIVSVSFLQKCDSSFFCTSGNAVYLSDKGRKLFRTDFSVFLDSVCPDKYTVNGFSRSYNGYIKAIAAELAAAADRYGSDIAAQTEGRCG